MRECRWLTSRQLQLVIRCQGFSAPALLHINVIKHCRPKLALTCTATEMASDPDPEDVNLLLEAAKSRQKFPRSFANGLQTVANTDANTTERIFFDCGGPSAWVAYALTKRSADNTGHVSGKGKRQRLLARIEAQPVEARQALAKELATVLEDDRARIERVLETTAQRASRSRQGRQASAESSPADADTPEPIAVSPVRTLDRPHASTRRLYMDNAEECFEQGHVLVDASVSECIQLFPSYLAGAVRRIAGPGQTIKAAVSIVLPYRDWTDCILRVEVISSKIDHIARELFGAHLEVEDGARYLYLHGGSMATPDPRLILRGCRLDVLRPFFGACVADAIRATQACQRDINEGRDHTRCVSMGINRAADSTAEVYAALRLKEGALLRDRLWA